MMDDDDFEISCPFDMSHRVKKSRMQFHLLKCRLNKTKQEQARPNRERSSMKRCPFNAAHDVEAYNFDKHCELCPDRGNVLNWSTVHASSQAMVKVPCTPMVLPEEAENWDDSAHDTYDPTEKNMSKNVLRHLVGESKSARKHFRAEERDRFRQMEANAAAGGGGANIPGESARYNGSGLNNAYNYDEPMRMPKDFSRTMGVDDLPRLEPSIHGMGRGRPVNGTVAAQPPAAPGANNGAIKKVPIGNANGKNQKKRKAKNGNPPPAYEGLPPPPAAPASNRDRGVEGATRLMAGLGMGQGGGAVTNDSDGDWLSSTTAGGAGSAQDWISMAQLPREGPNHEHPELNRMPSEPGRGRGRLQQQLQEKRDQYDRL